MHFTTASAESPHLVVQGGFVRSLEKQVAIIRSLGFDLRIQVEHSLTGTWQSPLTILVENVRGQAINITQQGGDLCNVIRSDSALMFDVAGRASQQIYLTSPLPSEDFDFFFLGDLHGVYHHFQEIIAVANVQEPLFIMANGDLTHGGALRDYHRFVTLLGASRVPCFTSIGNHDRRTLGSRATYRKMLAPMYYAFDVGQVRFLVLDSSRKRGLPRIQYRWLERELQQARDKRVFVMLHRPPVCPKYNYLSFSASANVRRFLTLMRKYGVELVFGSHVHAFTEFTRQHVRYVVSGGGGGALWHPANVHHYVHVSVRRQDVDVRVVQLPTPEAKVSQRVKDAISFNVQYHFHRRKMFRRSGSERTQQNRVSESRQ